MNVRHKPEGYSSVSPYLIVDGASRTIKFLLEAFDGVRLREVPGPGGSRHSRRGATGRHGNHVNGWGRGLAANTVPCACVRFKCRRDL